MTTWTESQRIGLRPSPIEVWALRVAQCVERAVDDRMLRRADRDAAAGRRAFALDERRAAAASAWRGIRL